MITINPSKLNGEVIVPSSKSLAHRALICAALAQGKSTVTNVNFSDDVKATVDCLISLGVNISITNSCAVIDGRGFSFSGRAILDCKESGSTLRFLLPLTVALGIDAEFNGCGRLPLRPVKPLISELTSHGCSFTNSCLPFCISGKLQPGDYHICADETTQYISGLLMALPVLDGDSRLFCACNNASYVNLTIETMKLFGVDISYNGEYFFIKGNQTYSPTEFSLEGDWSAGAFFHCANALGSNVKINGLFEESAQGDRIIVPLLEKIKNNSHTTIDAFDCPDLVALFAVTSCALGKSVEIHNISKLRYKESDRVAAVAELLSALGGNVLVKQNSIIVSPSDLHGGDVHCFNDHRIIMAAALVSTAVNEPIKVLDDNNISKSYPDFFRDFVKLGGNINEHDLG